MAMKLGVIGLGKMGMAIARRAVNGGYEVVGYDPLEINIEQAQKCGINRASTISELAACVDVVWLMVPAGAVVDQVIQDLIPLLSKGMIVIDGGNSKFTDSIERAIYLKEHDIHFLDCGTSGGVHGYKHGFCLMIGGEVAAYKIVEPLLKVLAAPEGYQYVGPSGAGHYVKMVHNGIEYALLQAYAEGFHLLQEGEFKNLDLKNIAHLWQHGSVVRSWILQLLHHALERNPNFKELVGAIEENGTGSWTVQEAHKHGIPVHLIEQALSIRHWSRASGGNFATQLVALLRKEFGGHSVQKGKMPLKGLQ